MRGNYYSLSETVRDAPFAEIQFQREFELYFRKLEKSDPKRFEHISKIAETCKFDPSSRGFIAIPCYVQEPYLPRALTAYTGQTEKNFEIIICINAGSPRTEEEFYKGCAERKREIENYGKANGLKIHIFEEFFPDECPRLGNIRALLAEVICLAAREAEISDPVIISNDSDTVSLEPDYVKAYLEAFSNSMSLDYASGDVEWDTDYNNPSAAAKKVPELLMAQRIIGAMDYLVRQKQPLYTTIGLQHFGANMAYRASSYLAAGGYDISYKDGEDSYIHRQIMRMMRQHTSRADVKSPYERSIGIAKIQSSARRALRAILSNQGAILEQWEDYEEFTILETGEEDLIEACKKKKDLIQVEDIEKMMKGDNEALEKIARRFKYILEKTIVASGIIKDASFFTELFSFLGIKMKSHRRYGSQEWKFRPGNLEITNLDPQNSKSGLWYLGHYYGLC